MRVDMENKHLQNLMAVVNEYHQVLIQVNRSPFLVAFIVAPLRNNPHCVCKVELLFDFTRVETFDLTVFLKRV